MSLTLGQLLPKVYLEIGELTLSGLANSGSTSTLIDVNLINQYKDTAWKEGTLFILRDAGGAGAAPEGEFAGIASFAVDTGAFGTYGTFGSAVGASDLYAVSSPAYPIRIAVQLVNLALIDLGDVPLVDTTTLETAANQTEYAAAVSWKRKPPYRVDIQGRLGDADDNQWAEILDWEYIPAAGGSTGLVVFKSHLPVGHDIRIWYRDQHPTVRLYTDYINEIFDPELVVVTVAEKMLSWKNGQLRGQDAYLLQKLNLMTARKQNLMTERRPWRPRKRPHLLITRGGYDTSQHPFTIPPAP
ncbi:hypothetical protein [Caudoviricetes sp.]|nr:hypothetical protein [Caudoviricetes sp.]UOF81091.1 hypothetical protein [Caudoviricetes sp.]UOF82228.1 hypothetical protein [Caudoviricetes sp.]UOF82436.1 hypothetical protein [Caudoviricetes sp.]UOF82635.1 hypothetical protein [Caudoviricetes sp.]